MAELITPNPNKHQYIVGIDFGHGETSAAICPIEWDTPAGEAEKKVTDIRINPVNTGNECVIVSAISLIDGQKPQIGTNAFGAEQLESKAKIRICFKQAPQSVDGEKELLMTAFMHAVYEKIREIQNELTNDNHIVYIARPSGWTDEKQKSLYCQMAINAGIPLGGLTSESRAAIFYALNDIQTGFKNSTEQGAIVFDLGSSTLDLTYIAKGKQPIDYGYPRGASLIDRVIYEDNILSNKGVKRLIESHPQYDAGLLFKAREIKESAYKKTNPNSAVDGSFLLRTVVAKECDLYSELKNEFVIVEYDNIDDLNKSLELRVQYITKLSQSLIDFQNNHLNGEKIYGVFLTGGASRMEFVADVVQKTYGLSKEQVKVDPHNPSLTISRGIALLGCADALSNQLVEKLRDKAHTMIPLFYDNFKTIVTDLLITNIWDIVMKQMSLFETSTKDLSINDFKTMINGAVAKYDYEQAILSSIQKTLQDSPEELRNGLNEIISIFSPGSEIRPVKMEKLEADLSKLHEIIQGSLGQLAHSISSGVSRSFDSFDAALIGLSRMFGFLGMAIAGLIVIVRKALNEASAKKAAAATKDMGIKRNIKERKDFIDSLHKLDEDNKEKLKSNIINFLTEDKDNDPKHLPDVQQLLDPVFCKYVDKFVDENINNVRIPIE